MTMNAIPGSMDYITGRVCPLIWRVSRETILGAVVGAVALPVLLYVLPIGLWNTRELAHAFSFTYPYLSIFGAVLFGTAFGVVQMGKEIHGVKEE
jgi:hypothetical protein